MNNFLTLIGSLILMVPLSILRGFVLSILWGWFFVPIFKLPALTIPGAIGVLLIVGFLTHEHSSNDRSAGSSFAADVLAPGLALLVGWVAMRWM